VVTRTVKKKSIEPGGPNKSKKKKKTVWGDDFIDVSSKKRKNGAKSPNKPYTVRAAGRGRKAESTKTQRGGKGGAGSKRRKGSSPLCSKETKAGTAAPKSQTKKHTATCFRRSPARAEASRMSIPARAPGMKKPGRSPGDLTMPWPGGPQDAMREKSTGGRKKNFSAYCQERKEQKAWGDQ